MAMAIEIGTQVTDSQGNGVGIIKEIRSYDLLLDRPLARDVYVPISAIQIGQDGLIALNIRGDQIDDMGWPHSDLI